MIYLSRLRLNPRSNQVQSELQNPYEMHRTLSKAFGDDKASYTAARCLFRLEETQGPCPVVLVQSRFEANWEALSALPRYLMDAPEQKSFNPMLRTGQSLAFRLRANPSICRDGKRVSLWEKSPGGETPIQRDERLARIEQRYGDWLHRKAEDAGFWVKQVSFISEGIVCCTTHARHSATLNSVLYDGVMCVSDPASLLTALEKGIGPGKGFGFGLLSLARA